MHLIRIDTVSLDDGEAAVDLGQQPGDLVVLSFTNSDLLGVANAHAACGPGFPSLRLAKLSRLRHPLSVDLYVETVVAKAKIVVIRCLGGLDYWRYGIERCTAAARAARHPDRDPAGRRAARSEARRTVDRARARGRSPRLFPRGGADNMRRMLSRIAAESGRDASSHPRPCAGSHGAPAAGAGPRHRFVRRRIAVGATRARGAPSTTRVRARTR